MRKYSAIDLLRFRTFADENKELKPMPLIKAYNEKYPEPTPKQQLNNLFLATGIDMLSTSDQRAQVELRRSGKPIYFIERMDTNKWWKPIKALKATAIASFDAWTSDPNICHAFEKREDAERRMEWIQEEHGYGNLEVTEHVFDDIEPKEANNEKEVP